MLTQDRLMTSKKTSIQSKVNQHQRRQPTQFRSQKTIETLFQAAAQILDREGEAGLTTNKVAEAAGFSIGTLYQYFPSKEALVRAMANRGTDLVVHSLGSYLSELENSADVQSMDARLMIGKLIRILLRGFAAGNSLSQSMIRLCWKLEQPDETASAVRQVSDRLAIFFERVNHPLLQVPTAAEMFVLTRSIIGTLRSASLEKSPLLGGAALESVLVHLAWVMLQRKQ